MEQIIEQLYLQFPILKQVFFAVVFLRVINKPLFSAISKYVELTETTKDNEVFKKIVNSKVYKSISYILDWSASIKLPRGKK